MKTFSIIIPVYNGVDVIGLALDSIYSQGLANEQFEVICVDDCSPTMDTFDFLSNYTFEGVHPENLKVVRHEINKRQGGARNTAFSNAEGEWVLYLDQDDHFIPNALHTLCTNISLYSNCDIVMFDYQLVTSGKIENAIYTNQSFLTEVISGADFIQKYPIPWGPWCYAYKRNFLAEHNILFVENVRFPDTDYVIKSTLLAHKMVFLPIDVYSHIHYDGNTSSVGHDKFRIEDLFNLTNRMKIVAEPFMQTNKAAAQAAIGHHIFRYQNLLKTILWRLKYSDILDILRKYPPYKQSGNKLINFTIKHPRFYAVFSQVARPTLLSAVWVKNKLRKS